MSQVVGRERLTQRLGALNFATHHTSTQRHTGLVPKIHIGNVALPVVLCGVFLVVHVDVVAIVLKHVSLFLHLNPVRTSWHIDGEGTLIVGFHTLLQVVEERLPVNLELCSRHRDARAVVEHLTCEHVIFTQRQHHVGEFVLVL